LRVRLGKQLQRSGIVEAAARLQVDDPRIGTDLALEVERGSVAAVLPNPCGNLC
jgi:hypothetical protein